MKFFVVGLGGFVGAILRVVLTGLFPAYLVNLPLPILLINAIGSLVIGALMETFALYGAPYLNVQRFLIQGVLASFTTFSTFTLESALLFKKESLAISLLYIASTLALSFIGFFFGFKIVRLIYSFGH